MKMDKSKILKLGMGVSADLLEQIAARFVHKAQKY